MYMIVTKAVLHYSEIDYGYVREALYEATSHPTAHRLLTQIHHLTSEIYCDVLVRKYPNTILTHDQGTIEVCSDIHCCS